MLVISLIFSILLILIIGFLFTPITLYIDTNERRYEIFQLPVFQFSILFKNNFPTVKFQLIGISIPLKRKRSEPVTPKKKGKTTRRFHRSLAAWRFMVNGIIKSFKVKRAVIDLDTDDVVLNAQLVPVFQLLSRGPVQLHSNFNGRVYLHLEMYNQPVRILWIFIQLLTKK